MPSKRTSNYNLCQWEPDDKVLRTDFNADNLAIDAALKNLDTGLAGKASTSALNSLQSTVTALQNTVSQKQNTSSAVKIAAGTYTGEGLSGQGNARSLNFSASLGKLPELLIIRETAGGSDGLILLRGMTQSSMNLSGSLGSGSSVMITWNESAKTVTWYGTNTTSHFNVEGRVYRYFAIA